MNQFPIIIITGPTCTGKSTLAKKVSEEFDLPIIGKDEIKELLFDTLGSKDREWSKKLGVASIELLYMFIKKFLKVGKPFIIEANFRAERDSETFQRLQREYNFFPIQINCKCDGEVLFERFKKRSKSGQRHLGHQDHLNYEEFKPTILQGGREPLDIEGKVIDFDSTDLEAIDYETIFEEIRSVIKKA